MKTGVLCILIIALSLSALPQPAPQTGSDGTRQQQIDDTTAQLKNTILQLNNTLGDLEALDDSDAALKKSDQAQIETSQMIDKGLYKIEHEDIPGITERGRRWDNERQQYIDSGCPPGGGMVPAAVADRCNPIKDRLNAEREKLLADAQSVMNSKAEYERLREDVAARTLANAAQEKANNARREDLLAQKIQLEAARKKFEARLIDLRNGIDSCARLLRQRGVTCETIKVKCGLIFDGGDPDLPASIYDSPCGKPAPVRAKASRVAVNK
jgi:hypothetical protein